MRGWRELLSATFLQVGALNVIACSAHLNLHSKSNSLRGAEFTIRNSRAPRVMCSAIADCVCGEAGPGKWDTWSPRQRGRRGSGGLCPHCSYCTLYPIPLDEAPCAGAACGGGGGRGQRLRETVSVQRLAAEPAYGGRSYTDATLQQQRLASASLTPSSTAPFALVQDTVRRGELRAIKPDRTRTRIRYRFGFLIALFD